MGPPIIQPLTAREQEVLRRISEMLSTAEVASEMYISINTVKAHVKSILRKLAAAHRGEAVRLGPPARTDLSPQRPDPQRPDLQRKYGTYFSACLHRRFAHSPVIG